MSLVAHRPLTAQDYRDLPEGAPRYQLIDGELHMAPAPNRSHQTVIGKLYTALDAYLATHPLGEIYLAPFDVYLTDLDVYQPDLSFFSTARCACLAEDGAHGAPDLVVEVLSPATARFDLGPKKSIYARAGVREYWVADPATRQLRRFDLTVDAALPAQTLSAADTLTSPLLPGLAIPLARVFPA